MSCQYNFLRAPQRKSKNLEVVEINHCLQIETRLPGNVFHDAAMLVVVVWIIMLFFWHSAGARKVLKCIMVPYTLTVTVNFLCKSFSKLQGPFHTDDLVHHAVTSRDA